MLLLLLLCFFVYGITNLLSTLRARERELHSLQMAREREKEVNENENTREENEKKSKNILILLCSLPFSLFLSCNLLFFFLFGSD